MLDKKTSIDFKNELNPLSEGNRFSESRKRISAGFAYVKKHNLKKFFEVLSKYNFKNVRTNKGYGPKDECLVEYGWIAKKDFHLEHYRTFHLDDDLTDFFQWVEINLPLPQNLTPPS